MLLTGRYGLSVHVPVYTTSGCIRHNMSHNAFAYYSAESVFVIEERKTCSHGMARHGARIRAAYMCAPSINITGGHSNQDPRCTQKPICTPIFTHHIRSWLLCTPVIDGRVKPHAPPRCHCHPEKKKKNVAFFPSFLFFFQISPPTFPFLNPRPDG